MCFKHWVLQQQLLIWVLQARLRCGKMTVRLCNLGRNHYRQIVRSLRKISNCFFLFLGPIIAVSLTNVRMIWTKPCSLQERHGKITLFIVQDFHKSCSFQFSGNPIATISIFGYSSNRTFILLRKVFDGLIMFKRY